MIIGLGNRLHAGIGTRVGCGERGQHLGERLSAGRPEFDDVRDAHPAFGKGARLIGADHVDAGQSLDGGQLLHQTPALTEPDDADRERDRGEQHQALGHHRHQRTHRPQHGLPPAGVRGEQLRVDRQQAGRHQQVGDELQDSVNAAAQFGFHQSELAGLLGQLAGIGLRADLGRAVGAGAGDDETARHHRIAGVLADRVRLAGQQRFVDLQVLLFEDLAVDDDLVPGAELDDVVKDHLTGHQRPSPGLPAHQGFRLSDDRQLVQGLFCPDLLDYPDHTVGDDEQAEQPVDDRTRRQHDHQQHAQDRIDPGENVGPDDV